MRPGWVLATALLLVATSAQAAPRARKHRSESVVPVAVAPPEPAPAPLLAVAIDSDPLLASPAAAPHSVSRWDEVARSLHARSTDLRLAVLDVDRAEGVWRTALAGALPTATAQGAYIHQLVSRPIAGSATTTDARGNPVPTIVNLPTLDALTANVSLAQPVVALAAWRGIGIASLEGDAARLSVVDAKRRLTQSIAGAVASTITAGRIAEANRNALRSALTRVALTARMNALGAATRVDMLRAELDAEAVRTVLVAGDETLRRAREALGLALGVAEPTDAAEPLFEDLTRSVASSCQSLAAGDERPDVAAQRLRAEAADGRVAQASLQAVPTLTARMDVSTTNVDVSAYPPTLVTVQGILTVPIWDGGVRYGNVRAARAVADQADERLHQLGRQAQIETEQALRSQRVAEDQLRSAQHTLGLARESERLQSVTFERGQGSSLELVVAAQQRRDAEKNVILRELDVLVAKVGSHLARARCSW